MQARARLLGHPIHQMSIVLPLGLLVGSFIFDLLYLVSGNDRWAEIAYWLIPVGVVTGLFAAVFGFVDWLAIPPGTRAKRIGVLHAVGNVLMLGTFVLSWLLRGNAPASPEGLAIALSALAVVLSGVTGWLGGELVDRLGIGVDEGAHVNAPSSLSERRVPSPGSASGR